MRTPRRRNWPGRLLTALGLILLVILGEAVPASTARAGDEPPVVLVGHVPRDLATATDLGPVQSDDPLTLTVALWPRSMAAFEAAVVEARSFDRSGGSTQSRPANPGSFGQPQTKIDDLTAYFQRFGLTVSPPASDGLSVGVKGRVGQVERAFSTSLNFYQDAAGRQYYAAARDPELPANLAVLVVAIFGLDNYPALVAPHRRQTLAASAIDGLVALGVTAGAYTPSDINAAYGVKTLHDIGLNGAGQTIGIIGCSAFTVADVNAFATRYGLPQTPITTILVDNGGTSPDAETTLDLEWSRAVAPGAAFRVYSFQSFQFGCPYYSFYDAIHQAVADNTAGILSISLAACESDYAHSGFLSAIDLQLAAASMNGQSVLVASGDSGAYACTDSSNVPIPGVDYPASSVYVTAVGGTNLTLNSNGGYQSESAWGSLSESCGMGACGSGGGASSTFAKPTWQSLASANTTNYRGVPDVSFDADPATGYVINYGGRLQTGYGGTSFGAPAWAGIAAIANQANRGRLGLLSPLVYGSAVANAQSTAEPPFHDVTTGTNLLYPATPGWDFATGWGSPNAYNLVLALVPAVAGTPTATSTITPTPGPTFGPFRVDLPVIMNGAQNTPIPTVAESPVLTPTITSTPTASRTATASPTATATTTATMSATLTATETTTASATATATASPSPTVTSTPTLTATATATP